ncbi:MAG: putative two-component sensor kinase [Labilithrix sp.]|nr:putative two-component sensor kinase [Labilithrix sp.]
MTVAHASDPDLEEGTPESREQETTHLRTQFLRRVAHDIASPTGVSMTVLDELVNAQHPRPELVAMARRSLRRLMRLSEHLALVAELEAGELEPELLRSDVASLVKLAYDDATTVDGRKDVVPSLRLPPAPVVLSVDARLVQSVVREIIGNALKLASTRVEVTIEAADDGAAIRVQDDGPGFPAEVLSSLGRRFIKRSSQRGLGLSLSMGKQIIEAHGGSITVEASTLPPGRAGKIGAAVVVRLPRRDVPEAPATEL